MVLSEQESFLVEGSENCGTRGQDRGYFALPLFLDHSVQGWRWELPYYVASSLSKYCRFLAPSLTGGVCTGTWPHSFPALGVAKLGVALPRGHALPRGTHHAGSSLLLGGR